MPRTSQVAYQVMWNRLISVVEEQAQVLVRTAFSTSVREAGDLSAGVYKEAGETRDFHRRVYAKYRELGTVANLLTFNRLGTLPTRNFQAGVFEEAEAIGHCQVAEVA